MFRHYLNSIWNAIIFYIYLDTFLKPGYDTSMDFLNRNMVPDMNTMKTK